jgi:hypothetical protein
MGAEFMTDEQLADRLAMYARRDDTEFQMADVLVEAALRLRHPERVPFPNPPVTVRLPKGTS